MFLGTYSRMLDAKGRIPVPPAFRAELSGGAYMTQGLDRNLQVLTVEAFRETCRRAAALNGADPLARLLLRLLLGTAVQLAPAAAGIAVPDDLRGYAQLNDKVMLVGQGDYFEIWSPDLWQQQEAQMHNTEANVSRFASLSLGAIQGPTA